MIRTTLTMALALMLTQTASADNIKDNYKDYNKVRQPKDRRHLRSNAHHGPCSSRSLRNSFQQAQKVITE